MPVSPSLAEDLAAVLGDLYEAAEYALVDIIRRTLDEGYDIPGWAEAKLAQLQDLSAAVVKVVGALAAETGPAVVEAVAAAYQRGQQAAVAELAAVVPGAQALSTSPVVSRLATAVLDTTTEVTSSILRQTQDVYRQVIAQASTAPALGIESRRQATQRALDAFVDRGVVRFVDAAGRGWDMASYAEMALRSAVGRAAVDAHTDRLAEAGVDLVVVSDQPLHCGRCDPWAGKVLVRSGAPGAREVQVEHATDDGRMVTVKVAGSLPEARSKGLLHPNCRCSVSAYLPGVTTPPQAPPHPKGATYQDTQRQRALERRIRKWRRREAAALDADTARAARERAAAARADLQDLIKRTGLRRKPERENPMAGKAGREPLPDPTR